MKSMLKRIKAIERRLNTNNDIDNAPLSLELIEMLESLTGRKYTDAEKRDRNSNEPLSPELVAMIKRVANREVHV